MGDQLFDYQAADVLHLAQVRRALLLNQPGMGKSPVSISTLRLLSIAGEDVFPVLVVGPKSMKGTWAKEWSKWWPGVRTQILDGTKAQRIKQIERVASGEIQVLIVNWEGLRTDSRLAPYGSTRLRSCVKCQPAMSAGMDEAEVRKSLNACEKCPRELNAITWRSIIADEAHRAKDAQAKQTRALWALATEETKFRYALTGTPIANAPDDLWAALHFIDPVQFPVKTKFVDRWCQQTYNPFGGMNVVGLKPETKDEFFHIVDPLTRRIPKELVLTQLPPKLHSVRYAPMAPKQAKAYEQMRDDMVAELEGEVSEGRVIATSPMTQHLRLGQFASAYAEIDAEGKVRLTEPSNKLDALEEVLDELGDAPVAVFSASRQLIELAAVRLGKLGISFEKIVGGQSSEVRTASIARFQNGRARVMLATIQAGGTGITLTRASTMVVLSRTWSQIENAQAEDRIHRIGSEVHDAVNIIDIIAPGTIEERQREALAGKDDRLQEFVRDRETMLRMIRGSE